jgi:diacylglycerol kinase family enzyme
VKRAAILYNPIAGSGRARSMAERAHRLLAAQGYEVENLPTQRPGHAEALARGRAATLDLLLVAGGDGSIREALAGLGDQRSRVPVAILACGNANVVARELGIPRDAAGALEVLRSGTATPIDLGRINSELFLAMVGIGWDARTVRHLSQLRRTRWGARWYRLWADSAYFAAGLAGVFQWPPGRIRLSCSGRPFGRAYCAAQIANFRCYGKGWSMVPDAHSSSGQLHFQARKRAGPVFILWQLLAAMGSFRPPRFLSDPGNETRIVVHGDRPFALQVDGDDRGCFTRVEIEIEPRAAWILTPATQSPRLGSRETASTSPRTRSRFSPRTFRTVSGEWPRPSNPFVS